MIYRLPTLEELDVPSKQPTKADLLANESMSLKKNVLGTIIEYHDDDEEDLDDLDVEAKKSMTELESKFHWTFSALNIFFSNDKPCGQGYHKLHFLIIDRIKIKAPLFLLNLSRFKIFYC